MLIKGILCLTTTFVTLGGCASVLAQRMARPESLLACDYLSYQVTEDGRCIDLTYLTNDGVAINNSLSIKFMRTLRAKGIDISNTNDRCEEDTLAYYFAPANQMNFCANSINIKSTDDLVDERYINVIAHESVHAVQHCLGDPNDLTAIATGNSELWETYVSLLGYEKTQDILEAYNDASNPRNDYEKALEIEAWALEEKPELVLQLLKDLC